MERSVQPGNMRVGFSEEMILELDIKGYTGGREAKAVSLTNTASSDHDHAGLKDHWWAGEGGERSIIELLIKKVVAFVWDFERGESFGWIEIRIGSNL